MVPIYRDRGGEGVSVQRYTSGGCIRLPAAHLIEQVFEVRKGARDPRDGSRAGPLGQSGQLQQGGAFARGFQFDLERNARPYTVDVGVPGGAEDGAQAFAEGERGVVLLQV